MLHVQLQQYLPLAVLKLGDVATFNWLEVRKLQQYLPLAVLKQPLDPQSSKEEESCNSTYRLRY